MYIMKLKRLFIQYTTLGTFSCVDIYNLVTSCMVKLSIP